MNWRYTTDDITDYLEEVWGDAKTLHPDADILDELGITGSDTDAIISGYAKRFNVDLSGYLWYFHTESEAAVANSFYVAPYEKLGGRIPITLQMLVDFAHKGFWDITYPEEV